MKLYIRGFEKKKEEKKNCHQMVFNLIFIFCSFIVEDWEGCSVPCGEGIRRRKVECKIFLEFSKTVATLPDRSCPGPKPPTTEICYAGLCETPFRNLTSKVSNVAVVDSSNDITQDDMSVFEAAPLVSRQSAYGDADMMSLSVDNKKTSFAWKEVGYTTCSESCLGGKNPKINWVAMLL
jgi:hypothetical protein